VLVILASLNDETFAAKRTLAKLSQQGICVVLLSVTRGEVGTAEVKPKKSGEIREQQMRETAKYLGMSVYYLDYLNGELSNIDQFELLEDITCWIGLVQPQIIITSGPDGVSRHSDQVIISQIVTQAYDQYYRKGVLLYIWPPEASALSYGDSTPSTEDKNPLVCIDTSVDKLEKVQSPQSHSGQYVGLNRNSETEMYKTTCQEIYTLVRNKELDEGSLNWMDTYIVGLNSLKLPQV
jgi:LmbE family N-acetylglucosaminyl deacetylase